MNNKKRWMIAAVLLFVVVAGGVLVLSHPFVRVRLYWGDRFSGTFQMTVDGTAYQPQEAFWSYETEGIQPLDVGSDGAFHFEGGQYGEYVIGFYLDNRRLAELTGDGAFLGLPEDRIPLIYDYMSFNWWHITDMELTAELVKESETWVLKVYKCFTESTEDGSKPIPNVVEQSFDYLETAKGGRIYIL